MTDVITDGLIVCYDYEGPESTTFNVSFQVQMDNAITGQSLPIQITSDVYGMESITETLTITSPSNIRVAAISDLVVAEDGAIEGIEVVYHDTDKNSNVISVSGEHISATVNGHQSGATFDLIPSENFSGETLVTVTVADKYFPSDAHSAQFTLRVTPENDAPTLAIATTGLSVTQGANVKLDASASLDVDGDNLSITWSGPGTISSPNALVTQVSGLAVGDYTFTATLSDGQVSVEQDVTVSVAAEGEEKSSGAFHILSLLLSITFLARRRKQRN
ncbi:PKD domain-containing protein [Pseudoalteromonas sp. GB56]